MIQVALRTRHSLKPADLQVCNVSLSLATRETAIDGLLVALTPKEFAVLELLFLRRNSVLSKDVFLDHLYGDTSERHSVTIINVFVAPFGASWPRPGRES